MTMFRTLCLVSLGICLGAFLCLAPTTVEAQTASNSAQPNINTSPLNLTLSPVTVSIETTPGTTKSIPFKVRNNSTEKETLTVSFGTFVADESGQRPKLLDPKPGDTFLNWLQINESTFEVAPNEWKNLELSFSPPADAALSYYYTVMISRSQSSPRPGETVVQGSPALLVLATVSSPNAKRELQLESFRALTPILESLPQNLSVIIRNTGNVHITPVGNVFIDGEGKKDLAVLSLNAGNNAILPNSTREYQVNWSDPEPAEKNNGPFDWDFGQGSSLRWGKYTAHLLLVYDNGERDVPVESYVTFWVFPWRVLLLRLAVPIVPAVGVFLFMKLWSKRSAK